MIAFKTNAMSLNATAKVVIIKAIESDKVFIFAENEQPQCNCTGVVLLNHL